MGRCLDVIYLSGRSPSVSKWTLRRAILHIFTSMRTLTLYADYTRQDVHSIFDPDSNFTPQAGTWGMQGIVKLP
jgi:hypothetical protein